MTSVIDSLATNSLTAQQVEAMARPTEKATAADQENVAAEFESFFYSMLIKEMRQTLEQGLFGEEGSDAYGSLFDLYLGQHLGESSRLGIGQYISQDLDVEGTKTLDNTL